MEDLHVGPCLKLTGCHSAEWNCARISLLRNLPRNSQHVIFPINPRLPTEKKNRINKYHGGNNGMFNSQQIKQTQIHQAEQAGEGGDRWDTSVSVWGRKRGSRLVKVSEEQFLHKNKGWLVWLGPNYCPTQKGTSTPHCCCWISELPNLVIVI